MKTWMCQPSSRATLRAKVVSIPGVVSPQDCGVTKFTRRPRTRRACRRSSSASPTPCSTTATPRALSPNWSSASSVQALSVP
jgi:hypothetical protein